MTGSGRPVTEGGLQAGWLWEGLCEDLGRDSHTRRPGVVWPGLVALTPIMVRGCFQNSADNPLNTSELGQLFPEVGDIPSCCRDQGGGFPGFMSVPSGVQVLP